MARTTKTGASGTKATGAPAPRGAAGSASKSTRPAATKATAASASKANATTAPATKSRTKAAPVPAKPEVVTLKHLAGALSESRDMPKREAEAFVAELIGNVVAHIKDGAKVRIAGLGIFEVKNRPARMARNPATGAQVHVEASRKVAFRPAKDLKDSV